MQTFRFIGVLLVIALAAWILIRATTAVGNHPTPEVLGIGNAFEGSLQLPSDTIKGAFDTAKACMLRANDLGIDLNRAGDVGGWMSFAATAVITLIIGFFGRMPTSPGAAPNTDGLPACSVRTIGLLAALASVLTAFGSLSIVRSQEYFKRTDEVHDLIVHARAQVIGAQSAEEAQSVLDDLELKSCR